MLFTPGRNAIEDTTDVVIWTPSFSKDNASYYPCCLRRVCSKVLTMLIFGRMVRSQNGAQIFRMAERWFVRCKTCGTPLSNQDTSFVPDPIYGTTGGGGAYTWGTFFSLSLGLLAFVETVPAVGVVGEEVANLGTNLGGATSVALDGH
jgi:hypothetical protein